MKQILNSFFSKYFITGLFVLLSQWAIGQGRPIEEGFDYRTLPVAQSIEAKGKIEVLEFLSIFSKKFFQKFWWGRQDSNQPLVP